MSFLTVEEIINSLPTKKHERILVEEAKELQRKVPELTWNQAVLNTYNELRDDWIADSEAAYYEEYDYFEEELH